MKELNLLWSFDSVLWGTAMRDAAEDCGALGETIAFLDHFKDLPDPRQRAKVVYPLDEVLLLCLLAVLGGGK